MIRMNKVMHQRFAMYTDWLLLEVDDDGTLRALIDAARGQDGGGAWREHDFAPLLERLRRNGGSSYDPPTNGVDGRDLEAILAGATP
jgi:hypothetical protein